MKTKTLLAVALALCVTASAMGQTIVNITGATAFRVAALNSIKARFAATGVPFKIAYTGAFADFSGANVVIFEGEIAGLPGQTTIVRTSFNGSVQGIKALVDSPTSDPNYIPVAALSGVTAAVGGSNSGNGTQISPTLEAGTSDIAFSDVGIAATPFAGTTLQPATPAAGVVTFTMVASEGSPASLDTINTQNFRALWTTGFQPLSFFTSNEDDAGTFVFATGRNDGSGTRTTYLAETGYGIANTVQQFLVGASTSDEISAIYNVPAGGTSVRLAAVTPALSLSSANASTVWGQDLDGNGGYNSGSSLRTDLGKTSAAVTVYGVDGSDLFGGAIPVHMISWLSTGDAQNSRNAGARILGYNGVKLAEFAAGGGLGANDIAKITGGQYTAWSYQQMYLRADLTSGPKVTVYNQIKNNLVLGSSGIATGAMNAFRSVDGGVVAP